MPLPNMIKIFLISPHLGRTVRPSFGASRCCCSAAGHSVAVAEHSVAAAVAAVAQGPQGPAVPAKIQNSWPFLSLLLVVV